MINRGWQDKNARVSMCTIYYRLPIRISIRTILHDGDFFHRHATDTNMRLPISCKHNVTVPIFIFNYKYYRCNKLRNETNPGEVTSRRYEAV